jgi:hypothetical protein
MRMLRIFARLIRGAFAAALLCALGVIVFFWVRYQPRATLPALDILALSPDGGRVLGKARAPFEYFCPMHPDKVSDDPKQKCPICSMPPSKR